MSDIPKNFIEALSKVLSAPIEEKVEDFQDDDFVDSIFESIVGVSRGDFNPKQELNGDKSLTHPQRKDSDYLPGQAKHATTSPDVHYGDGGIKSANEKVDSILADKSKNHIYKWANKYTRKVHGRGISDQIPEVKSSLHKQAAIAAAYNLAAQDHPEYKKRVFEAYKSQRPDIIKETGAHDYDSLRVASYIKMSGQTEKQLHHIPLDMKFSTSDGSYKNSREMLRDVHLHGHLMTFAGGTHQEPSMGVVNKKTGLNPNETFRVVHDVFGHAIHGNQFGQQGEETAWAVHRQMYSPAGQAAMTAETRGQNSYVVYGHKNIDRQVEMRSLDTQKKEAIAKGQPYHHLDEKKSKIGASWEFAPNKSVLLPPEMLHPDFNGEMPHYLKDITKDITDKPTPDQMKKLAIHHNTDSDGNLNRKSSENDLKKLHTLYGNGQ